MAILAAKQRVSCLAAVIFPADDWALDTCRALTQLFWLRALFWLSRNGSRLKL